MAGSKKKLARWQRVALVAFQDMQNDPDFDSDIKLLRAIQFDDDLHIALLQIIRKYNAPRELYSLLEEYVRFARVNLEAVDPPLFLICEADNTAGPSDVPRVKARVLADRFESQPRVYILLTGEVQREDIIDFVNHYYDELIEPKLELIEGNRPGAQRSKQRDNLHRKVVLLRNEGKTYRQIASQTGLTEANVSKILERYRARKKFDIGSSFYNVENKSE